MVEHAGVGRFRSCSRDRPPSRRPPAASGTPSRRATDAPVLDEWTQRVESNRPRPGMSRLPHRSASLRMEGSLGIEPSPAISRTALCACTPHDVEIPVGPAPTWTRVAIWCFVCFSLGITKCMGSEESNLGRRVQSAWCCHYTNPQRMVRAGRLERPASRVSDGCSTN